MDAVPTLPMPPVTRKPGSPAPSGFSGAPAPRPGVRRPQIRPIPASPCPPLITPGAAPPPLRLLRPARPSSSLPSLCSCPSQRPWTAPPGGQTACFRKEPSCEGGGEVGTTLPQPAGSHGESTWWAGVGVCCSRVAGVTPLTGKGLSLRTGSLPSSWVLGVSLCLLSGPLSHAPFPMAQVGERPTSMPLRRWTGSGHCRHREAGPPRLNLKCPLCLGFCGAVGSGGPRTHAGEQQGQGRRPAGVTRGSHSFRPARHT